MQYFLEFTKSSGAGNDFVLINNMDGHLQFDKGGLAISLCSRHFGIGADGLLLLERTDNADFFMRYYNADGSYGGMCGNGGRCAARYAFLRGIARQRMKFEALGYIYNAEISGESVKLSMKDPSDIQLDLPIHVSSGTFSGSFVNTGSPHIVVFVEDIEMKGLMSIGREIRWHETFSPEGTNVNFATLVGKNTIALRTFERGVEDETLACGTGSVAAGVVASLHGGLSSPVSVKVRSGEELLVHFDRAGETWTNILLEGSAHMLFSGTAVYDSDLNHILDVSRGTRAGQSHP